jgi:hypothetical protein
VTLNTVFLSFANKKSTFFVQFDSCGSSSSVCFDSGREDGSSTYVFGLVVFVN